ncbi:MAG TPA: phosphoserine phosphatase SerB [Burkholderiales bacterium]|nr:phosphoserine phosphatase SerB [Burkholderiales bacterium]
MNLVLQGPSLLPAQVEHLARLSRASAVEDIHDKAFRLRDAKRVDVEAYCLETKIDYAWIPEGRRFADLKLLAMDMDSTLITIECIDELGDFAGKKAEVAAITAQAMRGELDYPASLRKRVSVLKDLSEGVLERVYAERLCLTPGAERLIAECKDHGVKLLLVSGGFTFFTGRLKERLGIDYTISNTLEIRDGKLTGQVVGEIVDADAKAAKFRAVLKELNASREQSVAIGDGANDLKMMAEAGISVAFRAKPVVRAQATCALNFSGLDAVINLFE